MSAFEDGRAFLAGQGLNLLAVFDTAALPTAITAPLQTSGVDMGCYQRLLLVGHGGRRLWDHIAPLLEQHHDPIDAFTRQQVDRFLKDYVNIKNYQFLYPFTDILIPLQQLGELAGWAHSSPIGSGISPIYGLWFAYRAAVLINAPLPLTSEPRRPSPCDHCPDKPCQTACPAGAVDATRPLALKRCMTHRLMGDSSCAARCLARLACPVAPEHRYPAGQIAYHYRHSRHTLQAWADNHPDWFAAA